MKVKLGILFISALVLASGCARKCPPCPINNTGAAGSYTSSAPMPSSTGSFNGSAPASSTSGSAYGASSTGRYVSK